jgi:hypothetical protein
MSFSILSIPGLEGDCRAGIRQNLCFQESFREKASAKFIETSRLRCMLIGGANKMACEFRGVELVLTREVNTAYEESKLWFTLPLYRGVRLGERVLCRRSHLHKCRRM